MRCYGDGLVLCSAQHVRCNSASFTHLQLMWTILHRLNLCKNSFHDCIGVNPKNEIWKSWSWYLNKTVARIRSALFKMCWILSDSSSEIRILYTFASDSELCERETRKVQTKQRWARSRTGSGWIRTKPILAGSGLDRTATFLKIIGSRLDRTEKNFVVLMWLYFCCVNVNVIILLLC